jgi:hypothetical protein
MFFIKTVIVLRKLNDDDDDQNISNYTDDNPA